jgi:hypothetical protein
MAAAKNKQDLSYVDIVRKDYSSSDISVSPYIRKDVENMNLEKYDQVVFEGTGLVQDLRATEINGLVRYITGLDEFATEVKKLPDEKRKARIKQIRETVSSLELELFGNRVDVDDPDFWVKTKLAPTNADFWQNIKMITTNYEIFLDPKDPNDLIKIIAIENNGFDDISPSLEAASNGATSTKWFLNKKRDNRVEEGALRQVKDDAIFELVKIRRETPQMLFLLCKNILPIANGYKIADKLEILYNDLSKFIEGESIEKDKKKAPVKFLNALKETKEYLTIRAYVLEAIFVKDLVTKADNKIYIKETGSMLGGNIEECVQHLMNPMNEKDLNFLEELITNIWKR